MNNFSDPSSYRRPNSQDLEDFIPQKRHNLILLGCSGVGKTSIALKFTADEFTEEYQPTKTDVYTKQMIVNGNNCHVDILDTAGQQQYAAIQEEYIRSGDGFILVFSITDLDSFEQMLELREDVLRICDGDDDDRPYIIVGNKSDLEKPEKGGPSARVVNDEQVKYLCQEWKTEYIETSAKKGKNIDKVFYHLIKKVQAFDIKVQKDRAFRAMAEMNEMNEQIFENEREREQREVSREEYSGFDSGHYTGRRGEKNFEKKFFKKNFFQKFFFTFLSEGR